MPEPATSQPTPSASDLVPLLACPVCGSTVQAGDGLLRCPSGHGFELRDGVPMMTPEGATFGRHDEWNRKQQAAIPEYQAELDDPDARRHTTAWTVGELFGEFWSAGLDQARVLDVGCGMYAEQAYFRSEWEGSRVARLVGVDPMFHPGQRSYEFVQGVAERLPFCDNTFDCVLFATSLDHIVDTEAAMREAARVLKPGGRLAIWISVFDPGLGLGVWQALMRVSREPLWKPRALLSYLRVLYALEVSRRLDWRDSYHLHRFELRRLMRPIHAAGYSISERLFIEEASQSVPHVFLRAEAGSPTG